MMVIMYMIWRFYIHIAILMYMKRRFLYFSILSLVLRSFHLLIYLFFFSYSFWTYFGHF